MAEPVTRSASPAQAQSNVALLDAQCSTEKWSTMLRAISL